MPENVNTSCFDLKNEQPSSDALVDTMIRVENVSMVFNMASEQLNSLKEYAISIARGKLFFEGFTAVDDVSLEIKKGDVFGIIGTNGSGKSTLLKIIAGVLEPTKGTCEINGSIAPLIELGAGFDLELSARENIYLNGALLGYSKAFIDEHFDEIVAFAEVEKFLEMPLKNYSSGMVARIAFAIATVIIPEILIVDEVLSVGDFMFQKKCEDRINELIETHGVTVLIVSHSNDQIARLCNKAIWIEKGHTRMMGDAEEVCRIYGALGGRVGSPESEQRVFEAIKNKPDSLRIPYRVVAGDDFYGTATRTATSIWKANELDTIAIACGVTHINTVLANGLAGALNIPVLQTKADHIPDSLMHTLSHFRPKKIYYFDFGLNGTPAFQQLQRLEWGPEIIEFSEDIALYALSKKIFHFGTQHELWGSTAVLVHFDDNPESLTLAPFIYKEKCPVFSSSQSSPLDPRDLLEQLVSHNFKKIIIAGKLVESDFISLCKEKGIEVVCFAQDTPYKTCMNMCKWILEQNYGSRHELCIASSTLGQWPDILSCGAYCAHNNTALLLEDPTNLDSIAACLDFVSEQKTEFSYLSFFGGESNLSELDRELLSQELM